MTFHRGSGGTSDHWNDDIHLDYLLAILVDGPVMALADGYHSPNQRLQFEAELHKLLIDKNHLSYQGIFQGDTNQIIPKNSS